MVTQAIMKEVYQRLDLSLKAQKLIEIIRTSPPSRRVSSYTGNVCVRYPSKKMGHIIQAESHKVELPIIYELEHDPAVFEYYDQPPSIKLNYPDKNGRNIGVLHTPDFFVIQENGIFWIEAKPEDELLRLQVKMPNRYTRDENGKWRCPPGELFAEEYGFSYMVKSSSEFNWIYLQNIQFLEDYLRSNSEEPDKKAIKAAHAVMGRGLWASLASLLSGNADLGADVIYQLIASEHLYVDLHNRPLTEKERVRVYRDRATFLALKSANSAAGQSQESCPSSKIDLKPGAAITWDGNGFIIINSGDTNISLQADDGSIVDIQTDSLLALAKEGKIMPAGDSSKLGAHDKTFEVITQASQKDLQEANRRYHILFNGKSEDRFHQEASERTKRGWWLNWQKAEVKYGNGYLGLLPRTKQRGNRASKLPVNSIALMEELIANDYETLKQKGKSAVYGKLLLKCEETGMIAPSYKTFANAVNARPKHKQAVKRRGPRAAYRHERFYWELDSTTPRHGVRPFEICHMDHTELDIELVSSSTRANLGRPWLTLLIDAYSRRILSIFLTFDPPSYRSCMMALRECVRRHGRLPQTLVVDNGKEFESVYFESLLAMYECAKKSRPPAKARFGSVCERLFGTTNTRFINNLQGNTQITKNVRQMTKSVNPKKHAVWTIEDLHKRLSEWCYKIYDTTEHFTLGQTPAAAFAQGINDSGYRASRIIAYDDNFIISTLPSTKKGTARVNPNLGVKINYIYYWSDELRNPEVENTRIHVRYDPYDIGTAYAYVRNRWIQCFSQHHATFAGRTEREILIATNELRRSKQRHAQQTSISARKLANFLQTVECDEAVLQKCKDDEMKRIIEPPSARANLRIVRANKVKIAEMPHEPDDSPQPEPNLAEPIVLEDF